MKKQQLRSFGLAEVEWRVDGVKLEWNCLFRIIVEIRGNLMDIIFRPLFTTRDHRIPHTILNAGFFFQNIQGDIIWKVWSSQVTVKGQKLATLESAQFSNDHIKLQLARLLWYLTTVQSRCVHLDWRHEWKRNTQWNENVSSGILQNIYTERKWNSWNVLKLQAEAAYEILINFIFGNLLNVSLLKTRRNFNEQIPKCSRAFKSCFSYFRCAFSPIEQLQTQLATSLSEEIGWKFSDFD